MNRFIKRTALILCALTIICTLLPGCSSHKDKNNISENESVLTAGGNEVSYGLYRYFFLNYKDAYTKEELEADAAGVYSKIEAEALESIKGMYAVLALCSEYGISVNDSSIKADVDITINNIKEQYIDEKEDPKGEKGFASDMKANYMTEDVLRFVSAVDACETALFTKLIEEGKIPSSEDELRSAIEGDEFIRVLQIYINAENGDTAEANRALAESVHAKAVGGADFDELIGSYSNDYSMTQSGYYICRGYMNEQFEAAAFALDVGEISSVIELSDGFHIIKRAEKDAAYINSHYDELTEQYQTCAFYDMIDSKTSSVTVSKTDNFANIKPENISLD